MVGSWYLKPSFNELSSYTYNHTHQMSKIFMLVNRKSLDQNILTIFFILQYTNLTKPFLVFFHTKWWWISIWFIRTSKTKFFDKDIQLWLSPYMTTGFIYGTPMLLKNDENHIACLVVCEVSIHSTFIDDIIIKVWFLLFQLIAPLPNKKT